MVRILWLRGGPESFWGLSPEDVGVLRGVELYHIDQLHDSFAWLRAQGLSPLPTKSEGLPPGSVLAIPEHGTGRSGPLDELVQLVRRLLGPGGCPWDQAQTHETLKRHLLEETYEVLEAIDSGDTAKLREELGDLLLQPLMHAEMARLAGGFDTDDVARAVVDKLVSRHPHVFGDVEAEDADAVLRNWDRIKKAEKGGAPESILTGVPVALPALLRAYEVSKRAARTGFEWPSMEALRAKVNEERAELDEALASGDAARIEAELGDLLFAVVNLARWAKVEPEDALRRMVDRFSARFRHMEASAERPLDQLSPEQWDALWVAAKAREPGAPNQG